jgi:hypothetical protein
VTNLLELPTCWYIVAGQPEDVYPGGALLQSGEAHLQRAEWEGASLIVELIVNGREPA